MLGLSGALVHTCKGKIYYLYFKDRSPVFKESLSAQECGMPTQVYRMQLFPEVRKHDGCRAFGQDLVVGFCPYLLKGLVRMSVALLRTFCPRCWLESGGIHYNQVMSRNLIMFLRFSGVH